MQKNRRAVWRGDSAFRGVVLVILRVEFHFRQSFMDISVDRTDLGTWWRKPQPWAKVTIPSDYPLSSTDGLQLATGHLYRLLFPKSTGGDL